MLSCSAQESNDSKSRKRMLSCSAQRVILLCSDRPSAGPREDQYFLGCFVFVLLMFCLSLVILLHSICRLYSKASIFDRYIIEPLWKVVSFSDRLIFINCQFRWIFKEIWIFSKICQIEAQYFFLTYLCAAQLFCAFTSVCDCFCSSSCHLLCSHWFRPSVCPLSHSCSILPARCPVTFCCFVFDRRIFAQGNAMS